VQIETSTAPVVAGEGGGDLTILWAEDGKSNLISANQPIYNCSEQDPGRIGQLILDVAQSGEFRPEDDTIPYCGNNYIGMVYMPNPELAYSPQRPSPNGGFDTVSNIASSVQYEVLFSVMEWASDEGDAELSPGSVYTHEIAKLYQQIKEDPSRYPRGLTVRILLGNYPELANFEWGLQIWDVINDLRKAGVDKMVDSEIGWKVEVANFEGVYPHSHTKFLIIDGKIAMAAGFNYGYLHFPFEHPSNKGADLFDLGIVLSGPIAQQVLVTYDDYWDGAEQLYCPDLSQDPDFLWTRDCVFSVAQATHIPEVQKYYLPGGTSNAYSLNRNLNFQESDEIILSVLAFAEESLDIMEVNFSLELICALDLLNDDVCSYDDALEYMKAIMTAVENNHTRVRVLVEKVNSNGMENRISAKEFTRELEKRGLDQFVEIKFFEGRMHSKAFLVDDELLVVGSQNFHYSAWDDGLAEYNLATDDPRAIETFKKMFDYYWETGIPWEEYE
jgi:phosphatidylserine/phosphatidylglycerophosphate/cardiolipin synthase-like enzyme